MKRYFMVLVCCILSTFMAACGNDSSSSTATSDAGLQMKSSVAGSAVSFPGQDTAAPSVPANLKATVISPYQIDLTWSASSDNVAVVSYKLFRNGILLVTQAANTTGFSDTALSGSTAYNYSVAACDLAGNCSAQSAVVNATTLATSINGLWAGSGGYLLVMNDSASTSTIALEIAPDFSTLKIWGGTGNSTSVSLSDLISGSNSLTTTISANTMHGMRKVGGVSEPYSAALAFAYLGGTYDGIWQKTDAANAFLAYLTINVSGTTMALVVDLALNSDYSVTYDLLAGIETAGVFNGASLLNSNKLLKLAFSSASVTGTYTVVRTPPSITGFTASQIFRVSR